MRVLQVVHGLPRGGLERGVVNLVNGLPYPALEQAVVCLDHRGAMADLVAPRVPVFTLDRRRHDLKLPFRLARVISAWRPDIVHCRNWNAWADTVAARQIARLGGHRPVLVWSFHGFADGDAMPARRRWAARLLASATHELAAVCEDSARRFAAAIGASADRFTVLYNGVDCQRFTPATAEHRAALRAEFGWPADRVVALSVASLTPIKNHAQLIDAVARLGAEHQQRLAVVMVGEGRLQAELQAGIDRLGLAHVVRLAGASDRVQSLLQAADLMVLPSRLEGMSNAILEAMACGLPVVANRVGGNVELVVDGRTGELCEPDDAEGMAHALAGLVNDPARRLAFGDAACARAISSFSIEAMMARYTAYYRRLGR